MYSYLDVLYITIIKKLQPITAKVHSISKQRLCKFA